MLPTSSRRELDRQDGLRLAQTALAERCHLAAQAAILAFEKARRSDLARAMSREVGGWQ